MRALTPARRAQLARYDREAQEADRQHILDQARMRGLRRHRIKRSLYRCARCHAVHSSDRRASGLSTDDYYRYGRLTCGPYAVCHNCLSEPRSPARPLWVTNDEEMFLWLLISDVRRLAKGQTSWTDSDLWRRRNWPFSDTLRSEIAARMECHQYIDDLIETSIWPLDDPRNDYRRMCMERAIRELPGYRELSTDAIRAELECRIRWYVMRHNHEWEKWPRLAVGVIPWVTEEEWEDRFYRSMPGGRRGRVTEPEPAPTPDQGW